MTYSWEGRYRCCREDGGKPKLRVELPTLKDHNVLGELDSIGLSVLVAGFTIGHDLDFKATTSSSNCPRELPGKQTLLSMEIRWVIRGSIGINPGIGPFSWDIGLSFSSELLVKTKSESVLLTCCGC